MADGSRTSRTVRISGPAAQIIRERRDAIQRLTGTRPTDAAVVSTLVILGAQHAPALIP